MANSIYFDLMVSNESWATVSLRALPAGSHIAGLWNYEISLPNGMARGVVQWAGENYLALVGAVVNDYFTHQNVSTSPKPVE